jgi:hypothetical protein
MSTTNFISGGYYLCRRFKRPSDVAPALPESLVTLSNCFTDIGPREWLLRSWNCTVGETAEKAALLGVTQELVVPMLDWCTEAKLNPHPCSFRTVEFATEFHRQFVRSRDVVVLGIGLHRELLDSFYSQLEKDFNHGYALIEQIEREEPLASWGTELGFEPLGFEATKFHSWLCHNAPAKIRAELGITTNEHGMIPTLEEAIRATYQLVATGAEPAIWEPWLVVQFDS